jgi:PAS domain S-box-containing protein
MPEGPTEMLVPIGTVKAAAWFFENSLDTFLTVQGDTLSKTNATWTRLTGWSPEDTEEHSLLGFIHPSDRDRVRAAFEGLHQEQRAEVEHRLSTASGEWLWVRSHIIRGKDDWLLMILRDLTAERRREADAEQARRAAGMLRATAGVTTWRYDPDLDLYEVNPDFTKPSKGLAAEHRVDGEEVRRAVHGADAPALHLAWQHGLDTGEPNIVEFRERGADGDWRHVRVAWQGVRQLASGRWEILGIAQDVTDLTAARDAALRGEEAARAAADAKTQFLANMSHEIRTPMNGVLGILHLIQADPPPTERRRLVEEALASGASLADLLNGIIDYSDVEAGRLQLAPQPIDPAAELDAVLAMYHPRASAKALALEGHVAPDIGGALVDPARLRQIAFHLIGNAVKFTDAGRIDVRLSAPGQGEKRRLRLEVQDTGAGIAAEAQAGLFERFRQADGSTTRRFGGSGLGLAITRGLAEAMGGRVGVMSREGDGSTFWAEVAAPACERPLREAEPEEAAWLAGLRVLVVEDNATNRLVATRLLGVMGAEVETAENGAEGVLAAERTDFDLIFMDIQMPVMDGVEATRRIRAMPPPRGQVPIVATTANVMPQQLATYRGCGINGVVAKPISPGALLAEVARLADATASAAQAGAG